jgi:hypothetical protein
MPKQFIFSVDDEEYFAYDMVSEQCSVLKEDGQQCKCKVIM